MIKISVIMPSLNVKDYIERALISVCNQTLSDIEIICVDAESNDGTWSIINKFSEKDKRIIAIKTPIRSYGYQVNLGLKVARGEYVAILETDDYVETDMYNYLYLVAKKYDCDYVKANYRTYWSLDNGEIVHNKRENLTENNLYNKLISPKEHPRLAYDDWYLWSGIYRKKFIEENNISLNETKGAAYQDIGFMVQVLDFAQQGIYVDKYFYNYCIDRTMSSTNTGKSWEYCYSEYSSLINKRRCVNQLLYIRMCKSYMCCVSENVSYKGKDLDNINEKIQWFREQIKIANALHLLTKDLFFFDEWKNLIQSINEKNLTDKNQNLLNEIKNNEIVIFGCGALGHKLTAFLFDNNIKINCYIDNNADLWGKKSQGIVIKAPETVKEMPTDVKLIVANVFHYEDMRKQLMEYGINDKDIYKFE